MARQPGLLSLPVVAPRSGTCPLHGGSFAQFEQEVDDELAHAGPAKDTESSPHPAEYIMPDRAYMLSGPVPLQRSYYRWGQQRRLSGHGYLSTFLRAIVICYSEVVLGSNSLPGACVRDHALYFAQIPYRASAFNTAIADSL